MIKHDNIIYARDIHAIGGVETKVNQIKLDFLLSKNRVKVIDEI